MPAITAVGENIAGIVQKGAMAGLAIMYIAWRDRKFFDKGRLGICTDMSLEAMNGFATAMASPSCLTILMACRSNDRGINQRAALDAHRFGLQRPRDFVK